MCMDLPRRRSPVVCCANPSPSVDAGQHCSVKLNRQQTSFGRHETFPLRFGWLPKSLLALREDAALLADPERAMRRLGVGRNMINAIHYWLQVCRLVDFNDGLARITALGDTLLGPPDAPNQGDRYLEDDATLWILHWLIATHAEQATGFFWFFNRFALPRFREPDALGALTDFAAEELHLRRAATTLKSDIATLLRLYAAVPGRTDEHLDALLAPLALIEADPEGGYRSPRGPRPFLPLVALEFALAQRFVIEPELSALPVRAILYADGDWAAPGAVFRLNEDGLMRHLERLVATYPNQYELRDTAGLHQLFWLARDQRPDPLAVLRRYYAGTPA